jgi:hypothetical protein
MSRTASVCLRVGLVGLAAIAAPITASAQEAKYFVYFAPGDQPGRNPKSQIYAAGVGLERALEEHLAIQVDIGALSYFDAEPSRTAGGIASFDVVGNAWAGQRTELFGVGGYSVVFGDDTMNLFNIGGGARHWFSEERAVLVEYRYHHGGEDALLKKFWTVRIGLVFR